MTATWGCDDAGSGPDTDGIMTAGAMAGGAMTGGAMTGGAMPMGGTPPPPMEVQNCQQACDRYAACGATDAVGTAEECASKCDRIVADGNQAPWFACLSVEACQLLHLCPIPDPSPLTCEQVCGLMDDCGSGLNLGDCAAQCAAAGETFQTCGEALYGGACDTATFDSCIAREVFPECERTCAAGVECNLVRANECLPNCIEASASDDPLTALRTQQRNRCAFGAGNNCEQLNECFNPPRPGQEVADPARLCELYRACGFEDVENFGFPCNDFIAGMGEEMIMCVTRELRNGCPPDPFELGWNCEEGGSNPLTDACLRICEGKVACGLLDQAEGQACATGCRPANRGAGSDALERTAASVECAFVNTCDELTMCLDDSGPARECRDHCATIAACGDGFDAGACEIDCDASWPRDRHEAHRACIADAGEDCDAVDACSLAPDPPCELLCAPFQACGDPTPLADCLHGCDDAYQQRPRSVANQIACTHLSRDDCFGVEECLFGGGGSPRGPACFAFCQGTTTCQGNPANFEACLTSCGDGLDGDDAIRLRAGNDCLEAVDPSDCAALDACIPDDINVDCDAQCARLSECGIDLPECADRCANDSLARIRSLAANDCIEGADECADVENCVFGDDNAGPQPPTAAEVCAAWAQCPAIVDFFGLCQDNIAFFQQSPESLLCLSELTLECPGENRLFEEINRCADLADGGNRLSGECEALCENQGLCAGDGFDIDECIQSCSDNIFGGQPDDLIRLQPRLDCAASWSCGALDDCIESSSPAGICAAQCEQRAACELVNDIPDCEAACERDFPRAREIAHRTCLAEANDCEAIAACTPARPLPCAAFCGVAEACNGGPDPECIAQCEDRGHLAPIEFGLQLACVLGAAGDCDEAGNCFEDPGEAGAACLKYCRATTECAEVQDGDLGGCLGECITGFRDANGLGFAAASECLDNLVPNAQCDALTACLPEGPLAVDCDAYCASLDACQVAPEECAVECAAEPNADAAGCVATAVNLAEGCGAVAQCIGFPAPAADDIARGLCARVSACGADDEFLCRLAHTPTLEGDDVRLACAEASACNNLAGCLEEELPASPEACAAICENAVACNQYADVDVCLAVCHGQDLSADTPAAFLADLAACLTDAFDGDVCDEGAARVCTTGASCDNAPDMVIVGPEGGRFDFNLVNQPDNYPSGQCGGGFDGEPASEQVFAIIVARPGRLSAEIVAADYDPLIFLRGECDNPGAEIACNDDFNGLLSRVEANVQPGTYYLFVEGFGGDRGPGTVAISIN